MLPCAKNKTEELYFFISNQKQSLKKILKRDKTRQDQTNSKEKQKNSWIIFVISVMVQALDKNKNDEKRRKQEKKPAKTRTI